MRPHLYLTAEKTGTLRSVDEARDATRTGLGRDLWGGILTRAEADLGMAPITPWSTFPEREARHDARRGHRVTRHESRSPLLVLLEEVDGT